MKFEEVIPALREGKKVRRKNWPVNTFIKVINKRLCRVLPSDTYTCHIDDITHWILSSGDPLPNWEIVKETKKVADYLVNSGAGTLTSTGFKVNYHLYTFEVGKQPTGAILVPGSEREEEV